MRETSDTPEHGFIGYSTDGETMSLWRIADLWKYAADLPVEWLAMESLSDLLDEQMFVTKREIAGEARRIFAADLSFPIIFSERGWLMDGSHRLMKALATGETHIRAVRFPKDPKPDSVRPLDEVNADEPGTRMDAIRATIAASNRRLAQAGRRARTRRRPRK